MELQNDYIGAIENYRAALKIDKSPGIYYSLSYVYYKLNKFNEALTEIKKALALNPNSESYLELAANIYISQKDFKNAADSYEKILTVDSTYTYGLYSLARLYQEMSMPAKAIIVYEKITNRIGFDFDVLRKMYEIYYSYKDYPKSVEVLENLLVLDPYNNDIKKLLATLYLSNNQPDDSKRMFEELLILNPDDKDIQTELVKIYFKENNTELAFEKFGKMLGKDTLGYYEKVQIGELYFNMMQQDEPSAEIASNIFSYLNKEYPEEWIPYYYIGAIDIITKKNNNYRENFLKAIQFADTSRDVYTNIGFSFFSQGDIADALSILNEGLAKYSDDFRMNYIKALTLQRDNRESESVEYFEKALLANPNEIQVLSALGLIYDNQGKYEKSEEIYERALKIDPQNALVLNNYAYNLSERGVKLDKALAMSKISLEIEPDNASYLDTIGWIYFKMKNYKQAKKFIEMSLKINPNSAVVMEHLGDIYFGMEDYANAKKFWNSSLDLNPGNAGLQDKIINLKSI
ncbi:MAG: tetratricopeptide repeat protein [Ignavibacteria bacterium]|nr:tetratricopeptide repeat protein [Ignavibacteria bacterium]